MLKLPINNEKFAVNLSKISTVVYSVEHTMEYDTSQTNMHLLLITLMQGHSQLWQSGNITASNHVVQVNEMGRKWVGITKTKS